MMASPAFDNWAGDVPNGSPEWFGTARLVGYVLVDAAKQERFTKAARCLANLAWFLDERQHRDLLDLENGRSSNCLDTFKEVMKNYKLAPSHDSSLVEQEDGGWKFSLPNPQEMTFEHSFFLALHLFGGPQKFQLDDPNDNRWREFSSDEAQFHRDQFHNNVRGQGGVLVFEDSTPANDHTDLRLTDWLAMILSGVMNPHRHYSPENATNRRFSPSLVETRVLHIVQAEVVIDNNADDVTVHFLIHPHTGTILPDKFGQFHRIGNKNREHMKTSLAHALTVDNIKKKQLAMCRWRQNVHSHLISTKKHKKIDTKNRPCLFVRKFTTIIVPDGNPRTVEQNHIDAWNGIDTIWWNQAAQVAVAPVVAENIKNV